MSDYSFKSSSTIKSILCASILALFLVAFPAFVSAESSEQSAQGSFKYTLEDGPTKYIEFKAISNGEGKASGKMIFSGAEEIPDQDVDGTGSKEFSGRIENLQIEVEFDGLVVERNRAVMSGTVTGSTIGEYIGNRVLLVVEDNGEGIEDKERADRFTLGLYRPVEMGWIPADAELEKDDGWGMTWIATDAEREDDKGIPSRPSTEITCQSFPLGTYDFVDIAEGVGNIQVQP
ncbi:MAG TPA: hypothetical protein VGX92_11960 [Pyrinomonadaceae bacterium]|jgi:hypothetical protein|nr:hypothetical protein [Pyrinomonadaceae bacterium]